MSIIKFEELKIGQKKFITKKISQENISNFTTLITKQAPHSTEASASFVNDRIPQSSLIGSILSVLVGSELPGKGYISINYEIFFPESNLTLEEGDIVKAESEIVKKTEDGLVKVKLTCLNQNNELVGWGTSLVKKLSF
ncbi:MAG: hypothetical protein CL944_01930 [Candidatus Diapherotrites archaeon]|uniref:MaoC family dehydratase n=1 Tax=Candidatus Iainarchaeum sp. TaxID=3101447 RepID=A0A2D6LPU6_9ARCH|nr:hypothetical protein [Candidatus Diapherotrites archaeon]